MKLPTVSKWRLQAGLSLATMTVALLVFSMACVTAADPKATNPKDGQPAAKEDKAAAKPEKKKKLTGAELYAINCNRCHPERYATEFTAAQWKTIMLHMRVRANLPAAQAKAIMKYLQEDAGN